MSDVAEADIESDSPDLLRLQHCLELAAHARGQTGPNPMVGAVVVDPEGNVAGEGYHRRCGESHAERIALEQAGAAAVGGTLYVNVEPCCHHGRTPPCTDAVIAAGIRRVVACHLDPDERVNGRGLEQLRDAGLSVEVGLLGEAAAELNEGYLRLKSAGLPMVTGKAALSLDARLATRLQQSQWLTGAESRGYAHELRAAHDAVTVGIGTVLADDPRLTARVEGASRPRFRVVLDSKLRTPTTARLFEDADSGVVIITTDAAERRRHAGLLDAGAQILVAEADRLGRVDLEDALRKLAGLGVASCLVEGGGTLLTSGFDAGIIDKVVLFYAPLLIGGADAPTLWGGEGTAELGAAPRLCRVRYRQLGPDWVVEGYLRRPRPPA